MTIHGGYGGLRRWRGGSGLWGGGRVRASRSSRRGRFGVLGGGREEVVVVVVDGVADGLAPGVGAGSVDVLVLGEVNRLRERLGQVGDGAGGSGFDVAADHGGDESSQGGAEIAGGEVVAGEEVGEVFAEFLRGAGAGFFLGVVEAEMGIFAGARSAATATIRERKRTQGHAVLFTERGHKSLLRLSFWDLRRKEPAGCRRYEHGPKTETPRRCRCAVINRIIVLRQKYNCQVKVLAAVWRSRRIASVYVVIELTLRPLHATETPRMRGRR